MAAVHNILLHQDSTALAVPLSLGLPLSSMPVFDGEKFVPGDITEGTAIDADALKISAVPVLLS